MRIYLEIYAYVMLALGIYSFLTTILNLAHFKRVARRSPLQTDGPLVSVIIPARNEETHLPVLLESMRKQTYRNMEILVIDDCSTDRTAEVIREAQKKDPRIRAFSGNGIRKAKNGKINAMLQIIPEARGEYLYCTDADTEHGENAVAYGYSVMKGNKLDIISGFPEEHCECYMGAVNMSSMILSVALIPHFLVRFISIPIFSIAIGQFVMMKKSAYDEVGGYEAIKDDVCDDMSICHRFVSAKKKYHFVDMSSYVKCNMYNERREAFMGIARSVNGIIPMNASAFLVVGIILFTFAHLIVSPIISLIIPLWSSMKTVMIIHTVGWALFYTGWYMTGRAVKLPRRVASSGPMAILATGAMYLYGLYVKLSGRHFVWKDRQV